MSKINIKNGIKFILDKFLLIGFVIGILVYGVFYFFTLSRSNISENYKFDIILNILTFFSLPFFLILCYLFLKKFSQVRQFGKPDIVHVGINIPFIGKLSNSTTNPILMKIIIFLPILLSLFFIFYGFVNSTGFNVIEQIKDFSKTPYVFEGIVEEKIEGEKRLNRNKIKGYFIVIDYVVFKVDQDVYFDVNEGNYIKIKYLPNSGLIVGNVEIKQEENV